jgi:hypothetical protein
MRAKFNLTNNRKHDTMLARGGVMNFFKTSSGVVVNLSHVVYIQKDDDNQKAQMWLLGMAQPIPVTKDDYASLMDILSYSESKLMVDVMEFSPLTLDQSMRMLTEIMLHFLAHSIAAQNGTLKDFPTTMVYERIANLMNVINTIDVFDEADEEKED